MKVKENQDEGVCHYLNKIMSFLEPNSTDRSWFPRGCTSQASKLRSHLGRNISFLWCEQLGVKEEQTFALGARGSELNAHHLLEMMMYLLYAHTKSLQLLAISRGSEYTAFYLQMPGFQSGYILKSVLNTAQTGWFWSSMQRLTFKHNRMPREQPDLCSKIKLMLTI